MDIREEITVEYNRYNAYIANNPGLMYTTDALSLYARYRQLLRGRLTSQAELSTLREDLRTYNQRSLGKE